MFYQQNEHDAFEQTFFNICSRMSPGGARRRVWTGGGRCLLRGGRGLLQERWPRPLRPRHLAPLRGGRSVHSLLRHLEVPVLTWDTAAHVQVTSRRHLRSHGSTSQDWLRESVFKSRDHWVLTTANLSREVTCRDGAWNSPGGAKTLRDQTLWEMLNKQDNT